MTFQMRRARLFTFIVIQMSGISWTVDGRHLCSNALYCTAFFFFFFPFTGYICEYQYYIPVGGKWYWMVAKLLEGGDCSADWKSRSPFYLSISVCFCACVCLCVCVHVCSVLHGVYVRVCASGFDEEQNEPELTAPLGHVRKKKFTWCRQIQPIFSRMERL